nr:PREDICTED: SRR1-like protein [Bemisia tabaci]
MSLEGDNAAEVWLKVVSKNRKRRKTPVFSCSGEGSIDAHQHSAAYIEKRVIEAEKEVEHSVFYSSFLNSLNLSLNEVGSTIQVILCYGIGSIAASVTSRFQLALVLLLKKRFQANVSVYDPIFSDLDKVLLNKFDLHVIAGPDNVKPEVNAETLVIFPHVPKELIENFLQVNWQRNLSKCYLLCNSFSKIREDNLDLILQKNYYHLYQAFNFHSEYRISNNFRFKDVFNDLSIHIFSTV